MKLVMTLLVRDSEELLRENIEFHLRQGVDFFIITDNLSVDGTRDIIEEYVAAGLAERIWEPEDTYSQARWVTRMARRAATEHAADWVINNDDDEFWSGRDRTLREELARVPLAWRAVQVERRNHPPLAEAPGETPFFETMIYRERQSFNVLGRPLQPKICHRAMPDVEVAQGNHSVSRSDAPVAAMKTDDITISHFPVRGFTAFARKIAHGGSAYARNTELNAHVGAHWRWLYELLKRGGLRQWYERQLLPRDRVLQKLLDGELVVDDSVLRALRPVREDLCSVVASSPSPMRTISPAS